MSRIKIIIFFVFTFSAVNIAQSYFIIKAGNSIFVPIGNQICADNIVVETGAVFINEDSSGTCGEVTIPGDNDIPVSGDIVSFSAKVIDNGNVLLKWRNLIENNITIYELERGLNKQNLETIGFISGNRESATHSFIDKLPSGKKYYYRIIQKNMDGSLKTSEIIEVSPGETKDFFLAQNYPNPFNPETNIKFQIASSGFVTLKLFDVLGNEVTTLINEEKEAGIYEVEFKSTNLSSGYYFYTLKAGNFIATKKFILIK